INKLAFLRRRTSRIGTQAQSGNFALFHLPPKSCSKIAHVLHKGSAMRNCNFDHFSTVIMDNEMDVIIVKVNGMDLFIKTASLVTINKRSWISAQSLANELAKCRQFTF